MKKYYIKVVVTSPVRCRFLVALSSGNNKKVDWMNIG